MRVADAEAPGSQVLAGDADADVSAVLDAEARIDDRRAARDAVADADRHAEIEPGAPRCSTSARTRRGSPTRSRELFGSSAASFFLTFWRRCHAISPSTFPPSHSAVDLSSVMNETCACSDSPTAYAGLSLLSRLSSGLTPAAGRTNGVLRRYEISPATFVSPTVVETLAPVDLDVFGKDQPISTRRPGARRSRRATDSSNGTRRVQPYSASWLSGRYLSCIPPCPESLASRSARRGIVVVPVGPPRLRSPPVIEHIECREVAARSGDAVAFPSELVVRADRQVGP